MILTPCRSCIKVIVDMGFEMSEAMTQSTKAQECSRCGKRWTVTREDDPKIQSPPPLSSRKPQGTFECCTGVGGKHKPWCLYA